GRYPPVRDVRPDVSEATAAVVQRCLRGRPDDRYPDAASLLDALVLCRGGIAQAPQSAARDDVTAATRTAGARLGDGAGRILVHGGPAGGSVCLTRGDGS